MKQINLWRDLISLIFKRRKKFLGFILGVIGVFILLLLYTLNFFSVESISEGVIGTYEEKDIPNVVTTILSEPLVGVDSRGLPKPGLAVKWESNKEATQYTLTLRDSLVWTDGTKVVASDLDISIPETQLTVVNEKTITFKLNEPFSPFLSLLNRPVFKKNTLMGVGPYYISQVKKEKNYVKKLILRSVNKELPQVVVRFYANEKLARSALALGEIQAILGVTEPDYFKSQQVLSSLSKVSYTQLVTVLYNVKDPFVSDESLRVGLSYAAPKIKNEVEATSPLSPNNWAFNNEVRDYLSSPDKAAPYFKKVQNLKDNTVTLTAIPSLKSVGERIVEAWNKAGVKANLRIEAGIPQNFQALLITENIPTDPDQYALWHSTQTKTNITKFSSPRVDKDLEDGRKVSDMETRKQRYQDFQKVLLDQAPATFLYFPKYNVIFLKKSEETLKKIIDKQLTNL
jgi:ABC-type transport system substrate-binding protein